eukprot:4239380-Heterocapsa_arctica.AAC.1
MVTSLLDKERIILLYCKKNKWGDYENHYDLMHPIPQQVYKGRTYNRRSDSQQIELETNEANQFNEKRKQTQLVEHDVDQDKFENLKFYRPKEDKETQRDCTATKRPTNKVKQGRRYKEEKKEGTRITTTNLSGSQFDYDF